MVKVFGLKQDPHPSPLSLQVAAPLSPHVHDIHLWPMTFLQQQHA